MNTHTRTSLALLALCLAAGPSLADAPPPDLTHLPVEFQVIMNIGIA
jgi:hypothetical protein